MRYVVILPTRHVFKQYPDIVRLLPTMTLDMGDILNPLLRELGGVTDADIDLDIDFHGVNEYLCQFFYENSGNDTVDGVMLNETLWMTLVHFVTEIYRIIRRQRRTLLLEIPNGFVHEISFRGWVGFDMEIEVGYTTMTRDPTTTGKT